MCVIDNPDNSVTYGYNQHDYTSKSGFSSVLMKIDSLGNGIYNESANEEISDLTIYPNPASDEIIINIPENKTINCELEFYSITGKIVLKMPLSEPQNRINISNFRNGIYILRIKVSGKYIYKKIVVNH